jgi:hypothetical protein
MLLNGCTDKIAEAVPEYRVIGQSITAGESDNYYYNNLSETEKRGYDKIKNAAANFEDYITFDDPLTDFQIIKLFHLVYTNENGIFWLSELASANQEQNSLKVTFRYNSGDAKAMQTKLDTKIREILADTPEKDSYKQIKYIHDYLVKHVDFTETGKNTHSAYGAIIDGTAQCEGYAFAFALMAKKLGYECITVTGTSKNGDSLAWN